jgi:hypothetical protein
MAIISPAGAIRPDTIECPPGPPGPPGLPGPQNILDIEILNLTLKMDQYESEMIEKLKRADELQDTRLRDELLAKGIRLMTSEEAFQFLRLTLKRAKDVGEK